MYVHKTFDFKVRSDLSINNKDIESISVEISSNKKRNTLVNILYRPPNGEIEPFEIFLNNVFTKTKNSNKAMHIAGDFNLNLLDHNTNRKVHNFLSLIYQNGMIPTINKPTRVTRKTATAIDHILTNFFVDTVFKTVIFKSDISDHFPICFLSQNSLPKQNNKENMFIYKRTYNTESIELFKQKLHETKWDEIMSFQNPDDAYKAFLKRFSTLYDTYFPEKKIKLKNKDLQSPWITKGIRRSSKRKQSLYEKFLKNQNEKNELEYKNYKHLFEAVKKRSKKLHFSKLILRYKNNIKKTWEVIKECIGKKKYNHENFPKKLVINNKDITNVDLIAENFNKYFSDIGPKLAKNIEVSSIDFRSYIKEHESVQSECDLTVNELKEAFFSLKINKSSGYDGISFNVVKNCFGLLIKPLMYIFNLSLAK